MPGDLPAAIDLDDGRAVERSFPRFGALARCVHGGVLQEQYGIGRGVGHARLVELALHPPGVLIRDEPGSDHAQLAHRVDPTPPPLGPGPSTVQVVVSAVGRSGPQSRGRVHNSFIRVRAVSYLQHCSRTVPAPQIARPPSYG
jgi:hypothetical protein